MASKTRRKKGGNAASEPQHTRLQLIRERHRKLILEPREMIAADLDDGTEDVLGAMQEAEESRLVETIGVMRF